MDITQLSVDQLKSLAYDTKVEIERHQQNLAVVEQQINVKMREDALAAADAAKEAARPKEDSSEPTDNGGQPAGEQPKQPEDGNPAADEQQE